MNSMGSLVSREHPIYHVRNYNEPNEELDKLHYPFCEDLGDKEVYYLDTEFQPKWQLYTINHPNFIEKLADTGENDFYTGSTFAGVGSEASNCFYEANPYSGERAKQLHFELATKDYTTDPETTVNSQIIQTISKNLEKHKHLINHSTFQFCFNHEPLFPANLRYLNFKYEDNKWLVKYLLKVKATPAGILYTFLKVKQTVPSSKTLKKLLTAAMVVVTVTGAFMLAGAIGAGGAGLADGAALNAVKGDLSKLNQANQLLAGAKSLLPDENGNVSYSFSKIHVSNTLKNNLLHNNNENPITYPLNITFPKFGMILRKGYYQSNNLRLAYDPGKFLANKFKEGITFFEDMEKDFPKPDLGIIGATNLIIYNLGDAGRYEGEEIKDTDGHTHGGFDIKFDKPVKEFIDVYACIGCGALGQGFTTLHSGYDSGSSDSLDRVITGSKGDVWEFTGEYIRDGQGRSFQEAYGFIPAGGTIPPGGGDIEIPLGEIEIPTPEPRDGDIGPDNDPIDPDPFDPSGGEPEIPTIEPDVPPDIDPNDPDIPPDIDPPPIEPDPPEIDPNDPDTGRDPEGGDYDVPPPDLENQLKILKICQTNAKKKIEELLASTECPYKILDKKNKTYHCNSTPINPMANSSYTPTGNFMADAGRYTECECGETVRQKEKKNNMVNSDYETDSELEEKEISEVDSKSESEEEINVEFAAYFYNNNYKPKDLNKVNLEEKREESQRNTIKELDISYKDLTDSLDLSDFVNLERLDCSYNRLVEYLPDSLEHFDCSANESEDAKVKVIEQELTQQQIQLLQKQQSQFQEQEKQINYLELRVQELTQLIKQQKQKIIQDFLNVLPEKELIQQLITTCLEFKKAEKQKLPSRKLKKECQRIEDELEEKLGEEFVEKIQFILSDCERLKGKTFLIEEQKQTLKQITDDKEEKELIIKHERVSQEQKEQFQSLKLEIAEMKGQLAIIKDRPTQQNINVEGGHALIGNQIGDNANLSYNRPIELFPKEQETENLASRAKRQLSISSQIDRENNKEIKLGEEQQAQIIQPTYGIPSSSKNN
ncbi:6556_t:CDS:10 [Entrophospora sp. SA101]|nr:6556_t:CDS:10 [Entrophospora sp. SA101]